MYGRVNPAFLHWWKSRRAECGETPGGGESRWEAGGWGGHGGGDGESFGVRRPLRFLAYKLDLEEKQVAELAKVLDDLKTERAQASVDDRRVRAMFADALSGETLDSAKLDEAGALRLKAAERLRDAVTKALARIHGLLDADQRERLAYLIRTGTLSI